MVKMNKPDWDEWEKFKNSKNDTLSKKELELLLTLHSVYFKHTYFVPCTCSSKTYNTWIDQLNVIHENGYN